MCQNLLAFFKDSCPLFTTSITTSNALNVHLPCCVKLGTLFTLASFFACARIVGGMFSLLVVCWSYMLPCLLQGTMDIMVLIPCLLILASNKLGGFNMVLQKVYIWTSCMNPKIVKNGLDLCNVQEHDFPKMGLKKLLHRIFQNHPTLNWHLWLLCKLLVCWHYDALQHAGICKNQSYLIFLLLLELHIAKSNYSLDRAEIFLIELIYIRFSYSCTYNSCKWCLYVLILDTCLYVAISWVVCFFHMS